MSACRLNATAATVDSVVREYLKDHPDADRQAVIRAASAMDANCSGLIQDCERNSAEYRGADALTRDIATFIRERELRSFSRSGFDYAQERRPDQCHQLLGGWSNPVSGVGVRLRRQA